MIDNASPDVDRDCLTAWNGCDWKGLYKNNAKKTSCVEYEVMKVAEFNYTIKDAG